MSKTVLILPDAHAHPDHDNERFSKLGKFIQKEKPDEVWCLGDFADMPSLSHHDRGKISFEGRRYTKDIECTVDAQKRLWGYRYKPKRIMVRGNHDCDNGRHGKVVADNPALAGTLSCADLQYQKYWDKVHPFKTVAFLDGFAVSHYFTSGVQGRPISGENIARTMLRKNLMSSICGHTHVYDDAEVADAIGRKRIGLCAGCFAHPEFVEGWNRDTVAKWWYGVVMLRGVHDGVCSGINKIGMEEL